MGRRSCHGQPRLAVDGPALGLQLDATIWCWAWAWTFHGRTRVRTVEPRLPHTGQLCKDRVEGQRRAQFKRHSTHASHRH